MKRCTCGLERHRASICRSEDKDEEMHDISESVLQIASLTWPLYGSAVSKECRLLLVTFLISHNKVDASPFNFHRKCNKLLFCLREIVTSVP